MVPLPPWSGKDAQRNKGFQSRDAAIHSQNKTQGTRRQPSTRRILFHTVLQNQNRWKLTAAESAPPDPNPEDRKVSLY